MPIKDTTLAVKLKKYNESSNEYYFANLTNNLVVNIIFTNGS